MEIFDAYVEDIAAQEKAKEKKSTKAGAGKEEGKQKKVNAMDLQVYTSTCYIVAINKVVAWTGYFHCPYIVNLYIHKFNQII